jgi:hypothetical protein
MLIYGQTVSDCPTGGKMMGIDKKKNWGSGQIGQEKF